jgi:hypothetical protein
MNRNDIIRMAREAGMEQIIAIHEDGTRTVELPDFVLLERFAALATAAERDACAKVCDDWPNGRDDIYSIGVAIRARGEK